MLARSNRRFRPGVSPLEGRLALSHAPLSMAHGAGQFIEEARHAAAPGSLDGKLDGRVHAIYILQPPGQEGVDVSINAAGYSPKLGGYGVKDFIMTDFDGYNAFMHRYPGIAQYRGALRFSDGQTLPIDWTVHSYRKDAVDRTFPIRMEGVILSESGEPMGTIHGQGRLKLVNADRFAQLYDLDAKLSGQLSPEAVRDFP